jgi:hypothetical protein
MAMGNAKPIKLLDHDVRIITPDRLAAEVIALVSSTIKISITACFRFETARSCF